MEFAERELDRVDLESGRGALDLLGVPGLLDGLRSVLEQRGLLADRAPSLERLRETLAGRYRVVGELGRGGNAARRRTKSDPNRSV
jgi:hypothetical protein